MERDIGIGWPCPVDEIILYTEVDTYADLPAAADCTGHIYIVKVATGTWPLNRNRAGLWRSDGASWTRLGAYPTAANLGLGTSDSPTFAGLEVTGKVGIGESSPDEELHITANSATIKLEDNGGNYGCIKIGNTWLTIEVDPDGAELSSALVFKVDGNEIGRWRWDGRLGIGATSPTSKLQVPGLLTYANNAAAITGGLTAGAFYRDNGDPDQVCVVH